jgi:hypothetical protein
VSLAARIATGQELPSEAFISHEAARYLGRMGFTVDFPRGGRTTVSRPLAPRASPFPPRVETRLQARLQDLDARFVHYLQVSARRMIFTGPSVYFYERAIKAQRESRSPDQLAAEEPFVELAYATLTAWGMHRMGESVATKLTEFTEFRRAVQLMISKVAPLWRLSILDLDSDQIGRVVDALGDAITLPGISTSRAPLVANSKVMHLILPDLVPPIDRTYTLSFFYGNLNPNRSAQQILRDVYPHFCELARAHAGAVRHESISGYLCRGHAKAMDNALVGYMLEHRTG